MRLRRFASYIAVAVVGSLGVSGTAIAVPDGPQASVEAADLAFNDALVKLRPYLAQNGSGELVLQAPAGVIAAVDPTAYDVINLSISIVNEAPSELATRAAIIDPEDPDTDIPPFPEDEVDQGPYGAGSAIKAFVKFVKAVWKPIVKAAKKTGKWAWYKAGRCADGAVSALWNFYDGSASDLAVDIATNKAVPIAVATAGCIRKL